MPIRPKHSFGVQPEPPARFVDRHEYVEAFRNALARSSSEGPVVLNYYGVGGIGKTSLRGELRRVLGEEHPEVVWAELNLANRDHRDTETALVVLRRGLERRFGVRFPSFELAVALFRQKRRPQDPLSVKQLPLLEEGSLLADLASVAGDVPLLQLLPAMSNVMVKTHKVFRDWWMRRGKQELGALQDMEPKEIEDRLPMFWASDLRDFLERERRPAVVFLDHYEDLWAERSAEGQHHDRDGWVRELAAHLSQGPGALCVVAGREKLRWEERDSDWGGHIDFRRLERLPDHFALELLASRGVGERDAQRAMLSASEGVPFYLDLLVHTYRQAQADGGLPGAGDLGTTPREVQERFLHHLDDAEEETLKVLSLARSFDRGVFEFLVKEFSTGYPVGKWDRLCSFSFIEAVHGEAQGPADRYAAHRMNPLMRRSLEEHQNPDQRESVHRALFEHHRRRLEGTAQGGAAVGENAAKAALAEAFYHAKNTMDVEQFSAWFDEMAEPFNLGAMWWFLVPMYEELLGLLDQRLGDAHPLVAYTGARLGSLYAQQGRHEEAERLYERALAANTETLGPQNPLTVTALDALGALRARQGRYGEAVPLFERAVALREELQGSEHVDTANSTHNLAAVYQHQEGYERAERLYDRALRVREEALGVGHPKTLDTMSNLAVLRSMQGREQDATSLHERVLELREEHLGAHHPGTAVSLQNLCLLYSNQGQHALAASAGLRALDINELALGPDHPATAGSAAELALAYSKQSKLGDAEALFRRALGVQVEVLGSDHPDTLRSVEGLGMVLAEGGRREEGAEALRSVAALRRETLGGGHPMTLQSLRALAILHLRGGNLEEGIRVLESAVSAASGPGGSRDPDNPAMATLHRDLLQAWAAHARTNSPSSAASLANLAGVATQDGDTERAEGLLKRALNLRKEAFGHDHSETAEGFYDLADFYRKTSRLREAEALYLKALEIQEEVLGERHPDTATSLNDLGAIRYLQGQPEEAEPLYRRALETRSELLGEGHRETISTLNNLAMVYAAQGRPARAEPPFEAVLAWREENLGRGDPATLQSLYNLAASAATLGRYDKPEPLFLELSRTASEALGQDHPLTLEATAVLEDIRAATEEG